ncbi:DUF3040 domain-containing protein [Streptomyces sp. NPDC046985]|uniref:DUF3040 domain-containing protein n=1 Tax=Streptomyces sp. NPDC046985 TaxID=3155377 RepID=UPI0033C9BB08
MSTSRLPEHEQRILDEIERALNRDRRLARRLRSSRRVPRFPALARDLAAYAPRPWTALILLAVSAALLGSGIATSAPGVIWAFALVLPPTLYTVLRLLCGRSRAV